MRWRIKIECPSSSWKLTILLADEQSGAVAVGALQQVERAGLGHYHGAFAMPVIYSEREWNQIVGESYFIQLAPGDRFGWAEPDGKVHQIAADHLETLKEEIYRVCYLSQASGEDEGGHAQSALSKQLDFQMTQEVLRAYGVWVKSVMKKVLEAIVTARQDDIQVPSRAWMSWISAILPANLQQATNLLALGIPSADIQRSRCSSGSR
jgi:hypothetical protein